MDLKTLTLLTAVAITAYFLGLSRVHNTIEYRYIPRSFDDLQKEPPQALALYRQLYE